MRRGQIGSEGLAVVVSPKRLEIALNTLGRCQNGAAWADPSLAHVYDQRRDNNNPTAGKNVRALSA